LGELPDVIGVRGLTPTATSWPSSPMGRNISTNSQLMIEKILGILNRYENILILGFGRE